MKDDPFHVEINRSGGMYELDVCAVSARPVRPFAGSEKIECVELCVDRTSKKVSGKNYRRDFVTVVLTPSQRDKLICALIEMRGY